MIGQRLKIARAASGLSLRDLEAKIGNLVTAQMIGRYERDEAMPGSAILIALADALDVSESYLVDQSDLRLEAVEFRKNRITSRKEEASVEATVLDAVERYLTVEDLVGLPSAAWTPPVGAPFPVRSLDEAEVAASRLRAIWNLGSDAIPNLSEFLEEHGIKVLVIPLPDSVSGLCCKIRQRNGRTIPVIVVNASDTGERQRLTIAHELGHILLDIRDKVDEEKASFRFGSALLIPAELLWAEVGQHRRAIAVGELLELKKLFGVSAQAIAYRCKELGIIGPGTHRGLFEDFTRLGWRSPPYAEPNPIAHEEPRRFHRLCFRALAEGFVSEAKAAELLRTSVRQLNSDMEQAQSA
jgi:Zn-dependent peptidase ImmA (M78 family)/transcriptional regulator with XRE-family HTH domain